MTHESSPARDGALAIASPVSRRRANARPRRLARASGTPDIPGLKIVWLAPWGDVAKAHPWRNIIVHQTEGPAGSARGGAQAQSKNPTRRGVMVWVETDGTVYWAVAEDLVPTHGDGANRNDNKYIDNSPTFHQVVGNISIGVEFAGNYPDVTRGPTEAQVAAWRILVKVLRARYGSRSTASMPTTGSTTRTRAIARAVHWQKWRGSGASNRGAGRRLHRCRPGESRDPYVVTIFFVRWWLVFLDDNARG